MVATQTKLRRGTNTQVAAMTPAEAEVVVNLSNDRLHLGDGIRPGGFPLPNAFDIQQQVFTFSAVGGTGDAITVTLDPAPPNYSQPLRFLFKPTSTNTGPATINANALGNKSIKKAGVSGITDLDAGDLVAGSFYEVVYDGTQFIVLSIQSSGIITVSQGDLNTSTGTGSIVIGSTAGTFLIGVGQIAGNVSNAARISIRESGLATGSSTSLPGGQYGFYPLTGRSGSGGSNAFTFLQRYINSSPPYDLGDGDVGGFIFIKYDSAGNILQTYTADTPPWAYNGPTETRCHYKCPISGKKYRKILTGSSVNKMIDGERSKVKLEEITHKIKNADMNLIPHPFDKCKDGEYVVMLDPMDDKVSRIIEAQNNGDTEIADEMLLKGHVKLDSQKISRKGPQGVHISRFKFKREK